MVSKNIKLKGFTIIELLVVIVVIGILAAISIVSFANVSNRGRTGSLSSAANNLLQKAVLYKQSNTSGNFAGSYPPTVATLTSLASTDPAYLTGVTSLNTTPTAAGVTSANNNVEYQICGISTGGTAPAVPTALAGAATTTLYTTSSAAIQTNAIITGIRVGYWDFGANAATYISEGKVSGTETPVSTAWNVACFTAP